MRALTKNLTLNEFVLVLVAVLSVVVLGCSSGGSGGGGGGKVLPTVSLTDEKEMGEPELRTKSLCKSKETTQIDSRVTSNLKFSGLAETKASGNGMTMEGTGTFSVAVLEKTEESMKYKFKMQLAMSGNGRSTNQNSETLTSVECAGNSVRQCRATTSGNGNSGFPSEFAKYLTIKKTSTGKVKVAGTEFTGVRKVTTGTVPIQTERGTFQAKIDADFITVPDFPSLDEGSSASTPGDDCGGIAYMRMTISQIDSLSMDMALIVTSYEGLQLSNQQK